MHSSSSRIRPSASQYNWDKFPEDTELAEALISHRRKQQTAEGSSENSHALIFQGEPETRRQQLIKFYNKSALKNTGSGEVGWRKPGTLDVLALAQYGLETVRAYHQMNALEDTIKSLPHMKQDNQAEAREFARAFIPLLSNWLKKPTGRTEFRNEDSVKAKRLLEFFANINELDGERNTSAPETEQLRRNAVGIQHAFYTALPANTFEIFDEALRPDYVQCVTDEIKEIGDKLLQSPRFANDPAIKPKRDKAAQHYEAAGERRAALGKKNTNELESAKKEDITLYGKAHEPKQLLPPPREIITNNPSRSESASALDDAPVMHALSDDHGDATIRTRSTPRKYFKRLLGPKYPPTFSLSVGETNVPTAQSAQYEPQLPAHKDFAEFFADPSSGHLKDIRVKASPKNDREDGMRAFTLTDDSNETKMDRREHEGSAFGKTLLECSASPSQYWNFREVTKNNWQANPSDLVRKSAATRALQKILRRADSGERKDKSKEPQGRK